jgi:hypothetical protein
MTARAIRPIMTPDEEQFMAFEGLVQWTRAVVYQAKRVSAAKDYISSENVMNNWTTEGRAAIHASHCEDHYFVIAAYKIIEYRRWNQDLGLCDTVDFSEIDKFNQRDIRDLRNMREHITDYFKGEGNTPNRWTVETSEYKADASSVVGNMIGGRLDYVNFSKSAERLLSQLLVLPIPFPHRPNRTTA